MLIADHMELFGHHHHVHAIGSLHGRCSSACYLSPIASAKRAISERWSHTYMARAGTWTAGDGEAHPAVLHAPTRGPGLPYVTQLDATPAAGCLGRWTAAPRRGHAHSPPAGRGFKLHRGSDSLPAVCAIGAPDGGRSTARRRRPRVSMTRHEGAACLGRCDAVWCCRGRSCMHPRAGRGYLSVRPDAAARGKPSCHGDHGVVHQHAHLRRNKSRETQTHDGLFWSDLNRDRADPRDGDVDRERERLVVEHPLLRCPRMAVAGTRTRHAWAGTSS